MPQQVEIISKHEAYKQAIFRIEEVHLKYEKYDGTMTPELVRLNLERGDSAAALMHNPTDDTLLLLEQFRYSTYHKDSGWIIEIPAGIIGENEEPLPAIQREVAEESGYRAAFVEHLHTFYLSPGGSSERLHLFYARLNPSNKAGPGGGVPHEGEDIRPITVTFNQAQEMMHSGQIVDAKTIIALQWLQLNRDQISQQK